jgi:hypothetical protein
MTDTHLAHIAAPAAPAAPARAAERSLWAIGAAAVALADLANALLYLLGTPFDLVPQTVLIPDQGPVTLARVLLSTTVGVAAGVATYGAIRRRAARPMPAFRRVALAVLLLSYTQPPLVLRGAPLRMVLTLDALHTVAAAITLWLVARAAAPARSGGPRAGR